MNFNPCTPLIRVASCICFREARSRSEHKEVADDEKLVNNLLTIYAEFEVNKFFPDDHSIKDGVDNKITSLACYSNSVQVNDYLFKFNFHFYFIYLLQKYINNAVFCSEDKLTAFQQEPKQMKETRLGEMTLGYGEVH